MLSPGDVRVQGYLDVLEDRLLLENPNARPHPWFDAGWQYQCGLERTSNMHLAADDVPAFLRSFLNGYAVDVLPNDGYVFNEHAVHGPPDKIFEEAAFLEALPRHAGDGRRRQPVAGPRHAPAWLAQGERISVMNAPTHFGTVAFEIVSDVDHARVSATIEMPARGGPKAIMLRLRRPSPCRSRA